jgi:hypothetical protein
MSASLIGRLRSSAFETIHHHSFDVLAGSCFSSKSSAKALPSWDSRTRWNNLCGGFRAWAIVKNLLTRRLKVPVGSHLGIQLLKCCQVYVGFLKHRSSLPVRLLPPIYVCPTFSFFGGRGFLLDWPCGFCSGFFPLNTRVMKRRNFTVRFSDEEFQALLAFADREHVILSAAVRWALEMALTDKNPDAPRSLNCREGPKHHHCYTLRQAGPKPSRVRLPCRRTRMVALMSLDPDTDQRGSRVNSGAHAAMTRAAS